MRIKKKSLADAVFFIVVTIFIFFAYAWISEQEYQENVATQFTQQDKNIYEYRK